MKKSNAKGNGSVMPELKSVVDDISDAEKILLDHRDELKQFIRVLKGTGLREFMLYLKSPWRIIWSNLLGGVFRGLGIIIGMTVVFAILIWLLGKFVNFPLIGEYFSHLKVLLENFVPENGYR